MIFMKNGIRTTRVYNNKRLLHTYNIMCNHLPRACWCTVVQTRVYAHSSRPTGIYQNHQVNNNNIMQAYTHTYIQHNAVRRR